MSDVNFRSDVQSVLAQMRLMQAQATQGLAPKPAADVAGPGEVGKTQDDFATMLKTATDRVNELQKQSGSLANAFVRGENNDLVSVMVASQKSTVAFQGLVHTRNQLVAAYQEIMKMTV